ncbi:hypothetical protein ACB092_10G023900 [Castanea dentata]
MAEATNTSSSSSVQDPALKEDISNPLFLHHAESPRAMLVSELLIVENYHVWVRSMRKTLVAKNKFGFVNGSITLSSPLIKTPAAVDAWIHCDNMVGSWLMKGESSITNYFTKLKLFWDQLQNFRPTPTCSCGKCTYNLPQKLEDLRLQESFMQFLMGLNESYSQIKGQILLMEPLPTINKVYSLLIQEERKEFQRQRQPICTHCGKLGHVMEKCFKLHGFPPSFKPKGKNFMVNQVNVQEACADNGHTSATFPFTQEQCQQFFYHVRDSNASCSSHLWWQGDSIQYGQQGSTHGQQCD